MAEIPHASVKDLLSTGYFFEELKNYTGPKEIDLPSFSRDYAVPYLTRRSESYHRAGQTNKGKILNLAVKYLSSANDEEIADSIFGLKKVAECEMEVNEKVLSQEDQSDRAEMLSCRQKSEAAQSLGKLLVSIIRMFKLAEVITKRDKSEKSEGVSDSIGDAIKDYWKLSIVPNAECEMRTAK